ncbi:substrate-binding domain-containing protein, partial [Saccharothrix sp. MB29]|nr:substrate-binding domain-containing protein [Saccharothrix sp. MB29]
MGGRTADVLDDPYAAACSPRRPGSPPPQIGVSLHWVPLHDPAAPARLAGQRGVDGIVLVNPTRAALAVLPKSARGRVAAIGVGARGVPAFDVDNGTGAARVVGHLVAGGRRRVAMVTGPAWLPCTDRAVDAYRRVVGEAGLPVRAVPGDFTAARGEEAAEVLARWPDTDAVFALGDLTALGALAALG